MVIDYPFTCKDLRRVAGECMRPGGIALTQRALDMCSLSDNCFVADIGCGTGGTLTHLERSGIHRLVGIDASNDMLSEALPQMISGRLIRGLAETLPFRNGSCDALFCECVLSLLDDKVRAVRESARVLKDGGYLVLSDLFDSGALEARADDANSRGLRTTKGFLSKESLLGMLSQFGFSLVLWEEHEQFLREFVARLILAGECPTGLRCGQERRQQKEAERRRISYFLLVARKSPTPFQSVAREGDAVS